MAEKDLVDGYRAYTDAEELAFDEHGATDGPVIPTTIGPISPVLTAVVGC